LNGAAVPVGGAAAEYRLFGAGEFNFGVGVGDVDFFLHICNSFRPIFKLVLTNQHYE
jgi:hypothetical protein